MEPSYVLQDYADKTCNSARHRPQEQEPDYAPRYFLPMLLGGQHQLEIVVLDSDFGGHHVVSG